MTKLRKMNRPNMESDLFFPVTELPRENRICPVAQWANVQCLIVEHNLFTLLYRLCILLVSSKGPLLSPTTRGECDKGRDLVLRILRIKFSLFSSIKLPWCCHQQLSNCLKSSPVVLLHHSQIVLQQLICQQESCGCSVSTHFDLLNRPYITLFPFPQGVLLSYSLCPYKLQLSNLVNLHVSKLD